MRLASGRAGGWLQRSRHCAAFALLSSSAAPEPPRHCLPNTGCREMMTTQAQAAKKTGKVESQGKGSTSRRVLEQLVHEKENAG